MGLLVARLVDRGAARGRSRGRTGKGCRWIRSTDVFRRACNVSIYYFVTTSTGCGQTHLRRHAVDCCRMVSSEDAKTERKFEEKNSPIEASTTTLGPIITVALHLDDVAPPSFSAPPPLLLGSTSLGQYLEVPTLSNPQWRFLFFRYGCLVRDMTEWRLPLVTQDHSTNYLMVRSASRGLDWTGRMGYHKNQDAPKTINTFPKQCYRFSSHITSRRPKPTDDHSQAEGEGTENGPRTTAGRTKRRSSLSANYIVHCGRAGRARLPKAAPVAAPVRCIYCAESSRHAGRAADDRRAQHIEDETLQPPASALCSLGASQLRENREARQVSSGWGGGGGRGQNGPSLVLYALQVRSVHAYLYMLQSPDLFSWSASDIELGFGSFGALRGGER